MMPGSDPFEEAYTAGVLDELEVARPPTVEGPLPAGIAPAEPLALTGCVIAGEQALDPGYVVVNGPVIAEVGAGSPPAGVRVFPTGGLLLPGLIDLHGHPEYNVFAAWEPPKLYRNRYLWRGSDEYRQVVRAPWLQLTEVRPDQPSLLRTLTRYAEARALVGGVTAIQGASGRYRGKEEALVRNVDLPIFGQHRARSMIDLGRAGPEVRQRLRQQIDQGKVTALYVHLAEGVDERSRKEFDELVEAKLLTEATVIIHGTALTRDQLGEVKDAGAKLVWSPQSNLRLYGQTTRVADALRIGVPVALGADWLPSGSTSLLAELKVARNALAAQGFVVEPKRLAAMVTRDAAAVAGLADSLGTLAPGRPADVLVLERRRPDPWENVAEALPAWVDLVMIGGDLAYGRADWIAELAAEAGRENLEPLLAWGKPMLLDTSYSVRASPEPPPRLAEIRGELIDRYPQVGPIFA
jgi:cytosine/adenosine deaminase-related metal-dependent hydrolase